MAVASILANITTSLEAGTIPTLEMGELPTLDMGQINPTAAHLKNPLNLTCDWTDFMDEMEPGYLAMVQYSLCFTSSSITTLTTANPHHQH